MVQSHILQVVNGDGEFNESGVGDFIKQHSISDVGVGYQVVAITGPQSSGKSTLMNAVVSKLASWMSRLRARPPTPAPKHSPELPLVYQVNHHSCLAALTRLSIIMAPAATLK